MSVTALEARTVRKAGEGCSGLAVEHPDWQLSAGRREEGSAAGPTLERTVMSPARGGELATLRVRGAGPERWCDSALDAPHKLQGWTTHEHSDHQ